MSDQPDDSKTEKAVKSEKAEQTPIALDLELPDEVAGDVKGGACVKGNHIPDPTTT